MEFSTSPPKLKTSAVGLVWWGGTSHHSGPWHVATGVRNNWINWRWDQWRWVAKKGIVLRYGHFPTWTFGIFQHVFFSLNFGKIDGEVYDFQLCPFFSLDGRGGVWLHRKKSSIPTCMGTACFKNWKITTWRLGRWILWHFCQASLHAAPAGSYASAVSQAPIKNLAIKS